VCELRKRRRTQTQWRADGRTQPRPARTAGRRRWQLKARTQLTQPSPKRTMTGRRWPRQPRQLTRTVASWPGSQTTIGPDGLTQTDEPWPRPTQWPSWPVWTDPIVVGRATDGRTDPAQTQADSPDPADPDGRTVEPSPIGGRPSPRQLLLVTVLCWASSGDPIDSGQIVDPVTQLSQLIGRSQWQKIIDPARTSDRPDEARRTVKWNWLLSQWTQPRPVSQPIIEAGQWPLEDIIDPDGRAQTDGNVDNDQWQPVSYCGQTKTDPAAIYWPDGPIGLLMTKWRWQPAQTDW